jgi:hypothetical protein
MVIPNGRRFGLTTIAALVAIPAISGARFCDPVASAAASIQSAAAGTSLIGCNN